MCSQACTVPFFPGKWMKITEDSPLIEENSQFFYVEQAAMQSSSPVCPWPVHWGGWPWPLVPIRLALRCVVCGLGICSSLFPLMVLDKSSDI